VSDTVFRANLAGYVRVLDDPPSFVLPVFFEEGNTRNCLRQEGGLSGRIRAFLPIDLEDLTLNTTTVRSHRKLGSPVILAYETADGSLLVGERTQLSESLKPVLEDPALKNRPFSRAALAEFCGIAGAAMDAEQDGIAFLAGLGRAQEYYRLNILARDVIKHNFLLQGKQPPPFRLFRRGTTLVVEAAEGFDKQVPELSATVDVAQETLQRVIGNSYQGLVCVPYVPRRTSTKAPRSCRVFISYHHSQGEWVLDRLAPCLKGGGAEVLIDVDRFSPDGISVYRHMDATQDRADRHVLVLSADYLTSSHCQREMQRAIAEDPKFEHGIMLPIRRGDVPESMKLPGAPDIDLQDDTNPAPWDLLLRACRARLGATAPDWLAARDALRRKLDEGRSVNFIAAGDSKWRELIDDITARPGKSFPLIEMNAGHATSRGALIKTILASIGAPRLVSRPPGELAAFARAISRHKFTTLGLLNFDIVRARRGYDRDLQNTLRYLVRDAHPRSLQLLIQSRVPVAELMPEQVFNSEGFLDTVILGTPSGSNTQSDAVFCAGDPIDRAQEAFVPRRAVSWEIEHQLMLAAGCPGIVLYGRRRTGKSTILRNLGQSLPPQALVTVVSMQDPEAFTSLGSFVRRVATAVATAWPNEPAAMPDQPDLVGLLALLGRVNERLRVEGHRLLLALDEYEMFDQKIGEGVFTEDLLGTIRQSFEAHRHIVWIFAGSHHMSELIHARWTSYLVSARTIEVPLFTEEETRALLTDPLRYSPLWLPDDPKRPRFAASLWGENGIERIHAEAGGWPHLVQLIAETVVDRLNEGTAPLQTRRCWSRRSTGRLLRAVACCANW
jgi:TIR domain